MHGKLIFIISVHRINAKLRFLTERGLAKTQHTLMCFLMS